MGAKQEEPVVRRLYYATAALDDLADIADHIAQESDSRAIAEAFVGKLKQKCERVAALPGTLGPARPELHADIRSTPMQNYVIFFRYRDDLIEIVNILEAHRDIDGHFRE